MTRERCSGASCTNFAEVGTPTTNAFNNTGLTASTTYRYRVRATDAAGNLSAYSGIVNGTTMEGQAPTAPTNLPTPWPSRTVIEVGAGAAAQVDGVALLPTLKVKSLAVIAPCEVVMSTMMPLMPRLYIDTAE